jgi:hypothetical protein
VIQGTGDPNVLARGAPRDPEPADDPGRRRKEPVTLVQASAFDLGQPSQTFDLELFDRAVQLREVLLDPRVRQIRQRLGSKRVDGRPQFAHRRICIEHMFETLSHGYDTLEGEAELEVAVFGRDEHDP